jgi:choline dehydrogenase-like flavoprotein
MIVHGGERLEDLSLQCDVVVVGSGAGGAATAAALAAAGAKVVILEEGCHHSSFDFRQREHEMLPLLYRDRATQRTRDRLVNVLQGRCVGGSTVVNMADCARVPDAVLEHWQRHFAVDIDAAEFHAATERAEAALGVTEIEDDKLNANNRKLRAGAERLGWRHARFRHNRTECIGCGYCLLGCAFDAKKSALVTLLPAACADGATLVSCARVDRVVVRGGRAVGVQGFLTGEHGDRPTAHARLDVTADAVVLACGAVHTPLLLQASEINSASGQIGRNLSLQPQIPVLAVYSERMVSFRGIPQSVYCDEHLVFDPEVGMTGFAIEGIAGGPAQTAGLIAASGQDHKRWMARYAHTGSCLVLVPDQPGGSVVADESGRARIDYTLHPEVERRIREGARAAARLYLAAGAEVVVPALQPLTEIRSEADLARLDDVVVKPESTTLLSAHPQGTCRMGEDASRAVVDSRGRFHGLDGLWITDASVFPTSASTHTMIPIMAFADLAARSIAQQRSARTS